MKYFNGNVRVPYNKKIVKKTLPVLSCIRYKYSVCVCVCVCVCQLNWIKCYPFLRIRLTKVASCTTSGALYGGETPTPSGSPEFTICFSDVHLAQFLVRLLFPFLSIFFWPLYCLPFFDLRLSINPLLFSNFSSD